jgi:hypothetical protein
VKDQVDSIFSDAISAIDEALQSSTTSASATNT